MSTSTHGACLCGAVTFTIAPPYRWFAHCHCSLCRKHHGTLFATGLGVARANLDWLGGKDDVVHYRATAAFERPFCRHCGSTVPAISHDERFWHVPAGLLDGDPGARPRSHIFVDSRSPLYELNDSLPRYATYPPGIDVPALERRAVTAKPGTIIGSCVCDGIAFEVAAVPRRLVNCYCSLCRRKSGAGFTSTLLATLGSPRRGAPTNALTWLRGAKNIRHYALPQPRQYGADFCADCGSPVPSIAATTAMVPAGSIDTDCRAVPAAHLYVGSKAPWVSITDSWPQFAELPPPFGDFQGSPPEQLKDWFR